MRAGALALVVSFGAPMFAPLLIVMSPAETDSVRAATATPHHPPRAHGYFNTLPPGAKLPSGPECKKRVRRSGWEPRPQNTKANKRIVAQPVRLPDNDAFNRAWQRKFKPRITGNFRGTTDEIIQWASCKWGISDEITRARAVKESHWRQGTFGDYEARSRGHCPPRWKGNPCPTSFGLLQSKWYFRPGTYPRTRVSTAFMLDSALAETRGCLEGMMWFGRVSRGRVWDCVGVWFSGEWRENYGGYVAGVKEILREKPWRRWSG
jgi:autotransporter family porin